MGMKSIFSKLISMFDAIWTCLHHSSDCSYLMQSLNMFVEMMKEIEIQGFSFRNAGAQTFQGKFLISTIFPGLLDLSFVLIFPNVAAGLMVAIMTQTI